MAAVAGLVSLLVVVVGAGVVAFDAGVVVLVFVDPAVLAGELSVVGAGAGAGAGAEVSGAELPDPEAAVTVTTRGAEPVFPAASVTE